MREGERGYRFEIPPRLYNIEFRFAETNFRQPAIVFFNVKISGQTLLNADLVEEAGAGQRSRTISELLRQMGFG